MKILSVDAFHFADDSAPLFMGATRRAAYYPGIPVLFGAAYDGTTSFRPGTRFGPDAIRMVSDGIETYSPAQDRDLEDRAFLDAGNIDLPFGSPAPAVAGVAAATREILAQGATPILLGGEHSLTAGAVQAVAEKHPELCVVQLDAHADLRDSYLGERYSHAAAMTRCLEHLGDSPELPNAARLLQIGIRSGTREEFQQMRTHGRRIDAQAAALTEHLKAWAGRPIYLTIDLDIFDPAYLPGTGTPEPGGIDWPTFEGLLAALSHDMQNGTQVVACDVMELAPNLDPSGISSVLAAKVVRELILAL